MLERLSIADESARGMAQHYQSEVEIDIALNQSMSSIRNEQGKKGCLTSQQLDESDLSVFFDDFEDQFDFASQLGQRKIRAGARDI